MQVNRYEKYLKYALKTSNRDIKIYYKKFEIHTKTIKLKTYEPPENLISRYIIKKFSRFFSIEFENDRSTSSDAM